MQGLRADGAGRRCYRELCTRNPGANGATVRLAAQPDAFTFIGSGFGHGVGMSQWGAVAMAQNGHTYEDILKHYYQGIEITRLGD